MHPFSYHNPVEILFETDSSKKIEAILKDENPLLVTSKGFRRHPIAPLLCSICNDKIIEVKSLPDFDFFREAYEKSQQYSHDSIVGFGGGSVLDAAKVLSVQTESFQNLESLIRNTESPNYSLKPTVAIPTIAGSGSEVTPWATVWDHRKKMKHSLHLPDLWYGSAICDPSLTVTLSKEQTVISALDALSHSLESIWNKNSNPISLILAKSAATSIIESLPLLVKDLKNLRLREQVMLATLQAGLAFSNTQTAIAHAISYFLTANLDVPHGIASSVNLPLIFQAALELPPLKTDLLEITTKEKLLDLFEKLSIPVQLKCYGLNQTSFSELENSLNGVGRLQNSLVNKEKILAMIKEEL